LDQQQIRIFLSSFGLAGSAGPVTGFRTVLNALGLLINPDGSNAAAVGLSLFFVVGSLVQIVGILFSKPLADRFGNKAVFITGMFVTMVATFLVFFVDPAGIRLMFALSILWAIGWGPTVPLLWVMIADVADYSEWQTSRRATGFMFAGVLFALKAGLSLGGALSAWVIDAFGYVPNAVQTERALLGIRLGASVYPAILMALCLICLASYKIGKKLNIQIHEELAERRKKFAPA
jgi:Na+/melibiose symporter-like transporter